LCELRHLLRGRPPPQCRAWHWLGQASSTPAVESQQCVPNVSWSLTAGSMEMFLTKYTVSAHRTVLLCKNRCSPATAASQGQLRLLLRKYVNHKIITSLVEHIVIRARSGTKNTDMEPAPFPLPSAPLPSLPVRSRSSISLSYLLSSILSPFPFPPNPVSPSSESSYGIWGSAVSSSSWVRDRAPAANTFVGFSRPEDISGDNNIVSFCVHQNVPTFTRGKN